MVTLITNYLEKTIPNLPNFYATRTTVRYEDTAQFDEGNTKVDYQPLHVVAVSKAKIHYRAGNEVVESGGSESDELRHNYLITHGTFGPIVTDLRRPLETPGQMKWARWEKGPEGTRAVFSFEIPAEESSDFEGGCCLPDADGENSFRKRAGYRGEVAVNPATGAILRLELQFDLRQFVPQDVDEIQIDYGPVRIGGETYLCPVRSIAIARGRSIVSLKVSSGSWDESFLSYGPYSTKMNEMRFSHYHVFRSEVRILPGFSPVK